MSNDLYRLKEEPGKHLADSNDTPGAKRGVYLDNESNKPCGAGEFVKVEDNDDDAASNDGSGSDGGDTAAILALIAMGIGIGAAATKAYPYVKEWFTDTVVPGVKKFYRKITKKPVENSGSVAIEKEDESGTEILSVDAFSHEVDEVLNEYKENMSSEEAKAHLLNIMLSAMYMASEIRKLSNAVITDESLSEDQKIELKASLEKLTTQNAANSINEILAQKVPLMDAVAIKRISATMGAPLISEGKFVPIETAIFKKALSINDEK
ncbi:hypothetical protein ACVS9P_08330 [Caproicibacterium sp. NSD3]